MMTCRKYLSLLLLCFIVFSPIDQVFAQDWQQSRPVSKVRKVPDAVVRKMQKDPDFRYANDPSYWREEPVETNGFWTKLLRTVSRSNFLKVLLYILLGAAIIFTIYQVMVANNFFFVARRKRIKAGEKRNESVDEWANLDERIREEARSGNYRGAVRYMYLRTLKLLSDNRLITLHAKSTNQDYLRQMNSHGSFGQFRNLTHIYEYVWYGEFVPDTSQFERISSTFNQFNPRS